MLTFVFLFSLSYYIHGVQSTISLLLYRPSSLSDTLSFELSSVARTWLTLRGNGLCFLKCYNTGYYRFPTGSPASGVAEFLETHFLSAFAASKSIAVNKDPGRNFTHV